MFTIDTHTHIIPKHIPDFTKKFGYGNFIQLDHHQPGRAWMMQGDFPLYTKRKLEEIYTRWNAKKAAERQAKAAAQPKPAEQAPKADAPKADYQKKEFHKPDHTKTQSYQNKPYKKDEPAKPVNDEMLQQLALKFKKG